MDDIIIKVEKLSKIYKLYNKNTDRLKEALSFSKKSYHHNHNALTEITFNVQKGENIGIIGTNGSGKSTLLKIITGVLNPSGGSVSIKGKISALLELGAGFNGEYTGLENIYLNGTIMGYTRNEMDAKVEDIINFADIGEFIYQPVKTYSSGMFARLAFAVAINVDPEILIVDEALSVGDIRFQIKCMNKMKEMMKGGTTVLFVSHDTNAIRRFCDKAIWLKNGNVEAIGEVNKIIDKYEDFLKLADKKIINTNVESDIKNDNGLIAEVINFEILDQKNEKIFEVNYDELIKIKVTYNVLDDNIENPVLGIALLSVNDDYMCGLNTLLDKFIISWNLGINTAVLEYQYGLRSTGGEYYFNVALFEETATVPIYYRDKIKNITIKSDYTGEGKYIIPHKWRTQEVNHE